MKHEVAGDPCTGLKWTRRTTQKIARELRALGIDISPRTVARILKKLRFSLRVNRKMIARASRPDRDEQFKYIARLRERFAKQNLPIVSIDAKKKEMVGNFKNGGTAWNRTAVLVNDHDFRSDAKGIALPNGIYDVRANRGTIFLGISHDTSDFVVDNLVRWWSTEGRKRYLNARKLLVLADGGGSNGPSYGAHQKGTTCAHQKGPTRPHPGLARTTQLPSFQVDLSRGSVPRVGQFMRLNGCQRGSVHAPGWVLLSEQTRVPSGERHRTRGTGPSSTGYRRDCATFTTWRSPYATTPPELRSGTRSSIACSARLARTGRAARWTATRRSSSTSAQRGRRPDCVSEPVS